MDRKSRNPQDVAELVLDLATIKQHIQKTRAKAIDGGMSPSQLHLFQCILHRSTVTYVSDAAEHLGISTSAVVQIIDSFKEPLIIRRPSVKDKRYIELHISQAGYEYIEKYREPVAKAYDEEIFSVLSDEDFYTFKRLAHILAN